ncbi:MAG: hypothetical protein ACRCXD_07690 [Luteolibacter sp.]
MSENENQPPAPSKQTSSVPLKKETVRITLKAADAPPAVPSATVPMAPPVRPPVPTAPPTPTAGPPRPSAPAPTIPLRAAGAPTPTLAPAPTIRLATTAAPAARPGGAAPTMALPKATVQLQAPTQPLGTSFSSPSQMAAGQADEEEEESGSDGLANILSGVGLAAALVVLVLQLMTANTWINAPDSQTPNDWMQLSPL